MNKWRRYTLKLVSEGRCPRCGKPSAPYYQCENHRLENRIKHALRLLCKHGVITKTFEGGYLIKDKNVKIRECQIKDDDKRKLPRHNKKPIDYKILAEDILRKNGRQMHIDDLLKEFTKRRLSGQG